MGARLRPGRPAPLRGRGVVGARMPLIAYNINLGTSDLEIAKRIAKAIRHSQRRLPLRQGHGRDAGGSGSIAQVSINMTDFKRTPLFRVFETVRSEAARYGVPVVGSEIVGLVPAEALWTRPTTTSSLEGFAPSQVLERRIRETE